MQNMSASALAQANALPVIIFLKQHDSHIFNDRTILCNGEIKVGRSVARLRPAANNAIFDCKVLSRSHAVIYYDDRKFILRDTNSSNGTFVNNVRINKEGEAANAEREITSGDFIRFGVEVLENGTNHGCIITQVKLYHPNGAEALPRDVLESPLEHEHEQLFQLCSHINESIFREKTIHKKIEDLKSLLDETKEMSDKSWEAMLNEERLLDKLELYDNQVRIFKENLSEDSLHFKLLTAYEEKSVFEQDSKKILEKRLKEKTMALSRVTELENCLADSERETKRLRENLEVSQETYQSVVNNLDQKLKELDKKLVDTSDQKKDLETKLQSTTEEFHALRDHLNNSEVSQDDKTHEKILELQQEADRLRGLLKENESRSHDLNEHALAEIAELDRFIDMQDDFASKNESLENVIESTQTKVMSNLVVGAQQFSESIRFIQLLQAELSNLEDLATTLPETKSVAIKQEEPSDEAEVSSSATLLHNHTASGKGDLSLANESLNSTVLKVRELANQTEASLSNYFRFISKNEPCIEARREEADGKESCIKEKLADLGVCNATVKMTDSQNLDYHRRIGNDDGCSENESMVNSMVSSFGSNFENSTHGESRADESHVVPINSLSKLSAPMAPEDDLEEDEVSNSVDSHSPISCKEFSLLKHQLDSTKRDLTNLQEALREQRKENENMRQELETLRNGDAIYESNSSSSEQSIASLNSLTKDYQEMKKKMNHIEEALALSKKEYLSKVEESRQLRQELQAMNEDRDSLKNRLENAVADLATVSQQSNSVGSSTSQTSSSEQRPPNTVLSYVNTTRLFKLTVIVVVSLMVLLFAMMNSILSRFAK